MNKATATKLGPFTGGINNASDPTTVADNELVDCVNFELDLDGSLVQRPPFLEDSSVTAITGAFVAIGHALINGVRYVIFSGPGGTFIYTGAAIVFSHTTLICKTAVQYLDNVYLVATEGSTVASGRWVPGSGFFTVPNMPRGEAAIFNKSRMFVVPGRGATTNPSRLTFSDPITNVILTWTATNIIDVHPGDGQNLIDLVVYNDNLMLFKRDSTYVLAYDISISDAVLRQVNPNIGATTTYCVVTFENSIFVYHDGSVFEISNFDFNQINRKVPFVYDASVPVGATRVNEVFMSLVGDRIIVRYYNRIYVYGLLTKTWTRWESASPILHNFGPLVMLPVTATQAVTPAYYAGSSLNNQRSTLAFIDGYNSGVVEQVLPATTPVAISSYIVTKNYDYGDSQHFKKLMWWGADLLTNNPIAAFVNPIIASYTVRWYDIQPFSWNALSNRLWYAPLQLAATVETDVSIVVNVLRKFVKFKKALRFREVNFKVVLSGDGSPASGPARLFSLTTLVSTKQTVSKQVT